MLRIEKIDRADHREIERLCTLAAEIWREHFTSIISKAQIEYMLAQFQSEDAIKRQVSGEGYIYYLAYLADEPAAYIGIVPQPAEGAVFLSKLYVKKSYRRQGLAKKLLEHALAPLDSGEYRRVYLTCNRYNDGSVAAYKKMGFLITDEVDKPIGNGMVMNDYIMTCTLPAHQP